MLVMYLVFLVRTLAEGLDELRDNLREVLEMLLEDGEPHFETEFIGTREVVIT